MKLDGPQSRRPATVPLLAAAMLLSGCATVQRDGPAELNALTGPQGAELAPQTMDRSATAEQLLAEPLTPDTAVRVALLLNPRLDELYAELDLAEADIVEAGLISNPRLGMTRLEGEGPFGGILTVFDLAQNITGLITREPRIRLAEQEYEVRKQQIGAEILALASEVRAAYYHYLGQQQVAELRRTMVDAAEATSELAGRFREAGNMTRREAARIKAGEARLRLASLRADTEAREAHRALDLLLGLPPHSRRWSVDRGLHGPLKELPDSDELQAVARRARYDLAAAQQEVERLQAALELSGSTRLLDEIEVGYERESEPFHPRFRGPHVTLALPLFDRRQGEIRRRRAELARQRAHLASLQARIDNQIDDARDHLVARAEAVISLRDALLPLQAEITEVTQRQVNFMLEGVFELMATRQEEYATQVAYTEALRDYWVTTAELERAIGAQIGSPGFDRLTVNSSSEGSSTHAHATQANADCGDGCSDPRGAGAHPAARGAGPSAHRVTPTHDGPHRPHADPDTERTQSAVRDEQRRQGIPPNRRGN